MKEFTKKGILQKTIISILVAIMLINFIFPTVVRAKGDEVGGVLYTPIQSLVVAIGDGLMSLVNKCAYGETVSPVLYLSTGSWWQFWGTYAILYVAFPPAALLYTVSAGLEYFEVTDTNMLPDSLQLPVFLISPEKIFSNEVPLLDVNIINPNEYKDYNGEIKESPVMVMQSAISRWYIDFRNLATVALLTILVYVAIRIIISSTSQDKAKYKQMFTDWLVAFCLLFFMHYIMSFSITMVESITDSIKSQNSGLQIPISIDTIVEKYDLDDEQKKILEVFRTNEGFYSTGLMGEARFKAQLNGIVKNGDLKDLIADGGSEQFAYTTIYIVLVIYTIMFLFIYIKRVIYIIFLTVISPLVALTYPLDKMQDGKAQGFNTWLKEYIFNLLIQPLHLILYTLLVGTAMELASTYMIYPLVVLGFLLQSEKILRKLFGFEKSFTASSLVNGALGGALAMKGLSALGGGAKKMIKGGKGGKGGSDDSKDSKIRMASADRTADNPKGEDDYLVNSLNGGSNVNSSDNEAIIAEQYKNDGFDKNVDGEYYNPSTDEYDADYSPFKDPDYIRKTNIETDSNEEGIESNEEGIESNEEAIESNEEIEGKRNRFFSGVKELGGRYVSPNLKKAGLGLIKGAAIGIGAGTLGTIGVAAGLASDDFSNVAKYGAAGLGIGGTIGGNVGDKAIKLPSEAYRKGKEVSDTFRKGYYTKDEYKAIKNRQLDDQFMKDKEAQELYKEKFDKDYKTAMEKAKEYRKHGITDNEVIIKAMKAKSKYAGSDSADSRRIISAKLAKNVSNEKDVESIKKRLKEKGIRQEQIDDQAEMIRKIKGLV